MEPEKALDFDSVRLFVDRSVSVPTEGLDPEDMSIIVEMCRRLDGLPLAIELAAARTRSLSFSELAERLDLRFGLLGSEPTQSDDRQATLEAAIDWSYRLLTQQQQTVFSRLSVFKGEFDLEMAERIVGFAGVPEAHVARDVSALVEQSLITVRKYGSTNRYQLLETLRDFGVDRLTAAGHYEMMLNRHLDWAMGYADESLDRSFGHDRMSLIEDIGWHMGNLMGAIDWAEGTGSDPTVMRIVASVHWEDTGYLGLVRDQLNAALESCRQRLHEALIRSLLWRNLWALGHPKEALSEAARAYDLMKDEPATEIKSLAIWVYVRGITLDLDLDTADALPTADEGVAVAREIGVLDEVRARRNRSQVLVRIGHEDEAVVEANRAVEMAIEIGSSRTILLACYDAITTAMYTKSARRLEPRRLVDIILKKADTEEQLILLTADWLAQVYLQTGEFERAEEILDKDWRQSHLEGMDLESLLLPRTGLRWMQGDLEAAAQDVLRHQEAGVNPRWFQDYYAVRTEILADLGDLAGARRSANEYLETPVHRSEEVNKLGALNPLVRAEVDAALHDGHQRCEAAEGTIADMEHILSEFPPSHSGAPMWETHDTHLVFAKAELSRLEGSDPELWREAVDAADFFYYRLYAQWRLAESLLISAEIDKGSALLATVHGEAERVGATLMKQRAEATATEFEVEMS